MDWDKIRIFYAVAKAGSFTHAGEALHLSQSAISRQISGLEESLKASLFHRHARGLILTEQGEILYRAAHEVYGAVTQAQEELNAAKGKPTGVLKVTTTIALGETVVAPLVDKFLTLYPSIHLDLILSDTPLDLSMREADVAIRLTEPRQPDLIRRFLFSAHVHLYASEKYLQTHGTPQTLRDLDDHQILCYGNQTRPPVPNLNWLVGAGREGLGPRTPALTINNLIALRRAVATGAGIASLPDYLITDDLQLVRVMPEVEAPKIDIFYAYPEELRNSQKVIAFRDFFLSNVSQEDF
ncbi:MAG: LysR family transcriptional regulator [Alphaproteobacteria bacterium]